MNKDTKNKVSLVLGVLILGISVLLTIGVKTLFHACVHEDGTEAACFWAGQGIFVCAVIQSVTAVLLVLFKNRTSQLALSVVVICTGIITALIPGVIFRLCMMPSMRCNAVMKPWVLACAVASVLISLVNLIANRKPDRAGEGRS